MRVRPVLVGAKKLLLILCFAGDAALASDQSLVQAAKDQDYASVRALLNGRVDVNTPQGDGATALHWAAHWNDLQMAELLIHTGANVNAADDEGVTPLSLACLNGSAGMVDLLLKAGANPNAVPRNGETPLITAAYSGDIAVIKLLLVSKANASAKESSRGQTALMLAVAENHTDVVKALIQAGSDVGARSNTGFTPLLFAAQQGNIESARILLDAGANVDETAPDGIGGDTNARSLFKPNTQAGALLVAIDSNHEAMARFLLQNGADPNQHGAGRTPLHSAVQRAMPDLVKALLAKDADPNARLEKPMPLLSRYIGQQAGVDTNPLGATPFWLAASYGDAPMMRILVAAGADPLLKSRDNTTALMAAAGVDFIEGQDRYGRRWFQPTTMPLQLSALEAVKLCTELGVDVNAANGNGQTALHGAAYMGSNLIAQYLFDHGAKLDVQNKLGQTPYYITQGVYQAGSYIIRKETGNLLARLGANTRLGAELGHDGAAKQIVPAK